MLGHMLVSSNVKILEHWLQVDSLDLDGLLVFTKDHVHLSNFFIGHTEILLSCEISIVDSYCGNSGRWHLLDAIGSEGRVDVSAESNVVEHRFWIICLVLLGESIELLESQVEVEH